MSSLFVEVCEVNSVRQHPEADRLNLVGVKGWQIIAAKPSDLEPSTPDWKVGDRCVYFPPDTIVPESWTEKWGITKYTSAVAQQDGVPYRKIKSIRLRGERSEGFMCPCYDVNYMGDGRALFTIGQNISALFGAKKYEPPARELRSSDARQSNEPEWFHRYTGIENINNFIDVLQEGEPVVITEKIHGTNGRCGLSPDGEIVFGSHKRVCYDGMYVHAPVRHKVAQVLKKLGPTAIIFYEIYGSGIQDMTYGCVDEYQFRAFDIAVHGKYLSHDEFTGFCLTYDIPMVPVLYRGPYHIQMLRDLTDGPTTVCSDPKCKFKGREGVVVKPTAERYVRNSRVIFKSISVDYKSRKNAQDNE